MRIRRIYPCCVGAGFYPARQDAPAKTNAPRRIRKMFVGVDAHIDPAIRNCKFVRIIGANAKRPVGGGRPCPPVGYDHFRHRVSIKPERLPRGSMWASTSTDGLRFRIGVYGFAGLCRRAGQAPPLRYDETRYSSRIRTLLLISPLRGQLPLKGKPWCGAKPTHVQIHYYLYKTPGQASPAPEDVLAPGRGCRGLFLAAGIAAAAGRRAAAAGARADAAAGAAAVAAAAVTAAAAGRAGRRIRRGGADAGDGGGRGRAGAAAAAAGIAAGLPDKIRENDPAVHATGITHSGKASKKRCHGARRSMTSYDPMRQIVPICARRLPAAGAPSAARSPDRRSASPARAGRPGRAARASRPSVPVSSRSPRT